MVLRARGRSKLKTASAGVSGRILGGSGAKSPAMRGSILLRTMELRELPTPALVLDRGRMERNAERLRRRLEAGGVPLRIHVKTAKSVEAVRHVLGGRTAPIAVSTLLEAEQFHAAGFRDLLYAVGLAPNRFERVAQLTRAGARVTVLLDGLELAREWRRFCRERALEVPTLVEVDTDGKRAGVRPEGAELLELAEELSSGGLFGGLLTHAGGSYGSRSPEDLRRFARAEREGILVAAHRLRGQGLPVPTVSVGSTPTALFSESYADVTEVRAGVFLFMDLVMAGLGVCRLEDLALSVLTSVIGHSADRTRLFVDAGWTALSRDRGTAPQAFDQGYGLLCDVLGRPLEDLVVSDTHQEHGTISARPAAWLDTERFPAGTLLRILPNHACATAAQHGAYHLVDGSERVLGRWERFQGW